MSRADGTASFWISQNHKGQGVFHFVGADSISSAELLRGKVIFLPFEERVTLPSGMYFVSDLAGCTVFDHLEPANSVASSPCSLRHAPSAIGTVTGVEFIGEQQQGTPILHVDTSQGEHGHYLPVELDDPVHAISKAKQRIVFQVGAWRREIRPGPPLTNFAADCGNGKLG